MFGANGAGKTTLLRILATLLRPHARRGARAGPRAARARAGRCAAASGCSAHDPLLYRDLSARENLRFHARLHGVRRRARIEALLDAVGMARRADEPVRTLSRGMTQRVAICRAVLHEPELLLLDEPLANLDPGAAGAVEPLIGPGSGVTRVVISHDVAHGLAEADLVLGLRGGRQALLAPRAEIGEAAVAGALRVTRHADARRRRRADPQGPAAASCARSESRARDGAVQRHHVRALPLRARRALARGRPRRRRASG